MGIRKPNHRLVKIHRNYTVEEISELFGTHKNTVRRWIKDGLPLIDDKRPMLILGQDLIEFLQARRVKNKRTCKPGEIYCVRCRAPKSPAGNMAEYTRITKKVGNLMAICPDCNCLINKTFSLVKIEEITGLLDITFTEGMRHLNEISKPTVNGDLG